MSVKRVAFDERPIECARDRLPDARFAAPGHAHHHDRGMPAVGNCESRMLARRALDANGRAPDAGSQPTRKSA
jgi:hypothetical protein